ncbi:MAG: galactose mutarotase [Kiritimatiellaceae bacterium]|nr:galactose mutarotase [Kiritimatiellaceae bacterium]
MSLKKETFGKNPYGEDVELFTLTNTNGVQVRIMNHGATILSIETPDKSGQMADIVLGFDTAAEYGSGTPFFGCTVGRFANRIAHGRFKLGGKEFQLARNGDGIHALHGGDRGFDKRIWRAEPLAEKNAVRMSYRSPDGEENYPGNLDATVTFTLTEENELKLDYTAVTDRATPVNFTNHSYFNLAGHDAGCHGAQILTINADTFLPTDATGNPLGEIRPVKDTPFDFRTPAAIGQRIDADYEQLQIAKSPGYDHNFCLNKQSEGELSFAARAEDPASGRVMEVYTTEPGVQFYAGNFLKGKDQGKGGCAYVRRGGFCLETQHYPDSPNRPQFPNTILHPGELFASQTVYKFSVRRG